MKSREEQLETVKRREKFIAEHRKYEEDMGYDHRDSDFLQRMTDSWKKEMEES